MENLTVLW